MKLIFSITLFAVLFFTQLFAHAQINIDLPTIVIKPCAKAEKQLSSGLQRGKLIPSRAYIFKGPSVICEEVGQIKIGTDFIILGSAQSTFKKPWYRIENLENGQRAWIPTKYVKLLGKYNPKPQYTTSNLIGTFVLPSTELNIRSCPSTRCERIGSVDTGQRLHVLKKSSNDWYFIENLNSNLSGWISGKFVRVDKATAKAKDPITHPTPIIETHDPCKSMARVTPYKEFAIWRALEDFTVLEIPDKACLKILAIHKDQAIISLAENNTFYQLTVVIDDKLQTGYFPRKSFDNQYISMQKLPDDFKRNEAKKYILEAQEYWQSFRYTLDQSWLKTKSFYTNNPFTMWTATLALLLLILYLIPRTRWIVVGLYNAIIHILIKRELQEISSHWSQMVEGLNLTPTEFYSEFEQILQGKQMPDTRKLSISWTEGGLFSPKRLYFRVARKKIACDICCAPFGNGTFFSCWVGTFPSAILNFFYSLPILSCLAYFFEKFFRPMTYYQYDSMNMFHTLVHSALMECVDKHTSQQELKPMSADERKPTMKGFFDKKA